MAWNIATYVSTSLLYSKYAPCNIFWTVQYNRSNYGQIDKLFFFRKRPLPNSCLPNFTLV